MKLAIFGLAISSSWGNGHATLWRGLCRALIERGHRVIFFERDVPYYADHRDLYGLEGGELVLYSSWEEAAGIARAHLRDTDVAMVTSYCPDAIAAGELLGDSACPLRVFYDLDTPVTLARLDAGENVDYIDAGRGLRDFDLVLSYTGGEVLSELRDKLGARDVAPLYGSVDPLVHKPAPVLDRYRSHLSYLGTYAEDRQETLEELFIETARRLPEYRFLIGGSQYPQQFPWTDNIYFVRHVPPEHHGNFFCSSQLTLNVTRRAMAATGYCPSGRLFEAAACGVAIASDYWQGLADFYEPGKEILVCRNSGDVVQALQLPAEQLARIALAARRRTLECHTARHRAIQLEGFLDRALRKEPADPQAPHSVCMVEG
jgi:spore maturation protein CgeB